MPGDVAVGSGVSDLIRFMNGCGVVLQEERIIWE